MYFYLFIFIIQLYSQEISGRCGKNENDCKYIINETEQTLIITGEGEMNLAGTIIEEFPWRSYCQNNITTIIIKNKNIFFMLFISLNNFFIIFILPPIIIVSH